MEINSRGVVVVEKEEKIMSYITKLDFLFCRFILINAWGRHMHVMSRKVN
jgi:hypothetical protein